MPVIPPAYSDFEILYKPHGLSDVSISPRRDFTLQGIKHGESDFHQDLCGRHCVNSVIVRWFPYKDPIIIKGVLVQIERGHFEFEPENPDDWPKAHDLLVELGFNMRGREIRI